MNQIRIINARDLTPDVVEQWQTIADSERYLHSPFLQPAFTQAVTDIRNDGEIALIEDKGELTGLFPFQRGPRGLMRNICTRLSEFHTPILRPDAAFDGIELMQACGASHWQFDHLPTLDSPLAEYIWGTSTSPFADLRCGYDNYLRARKAAGSSSISQTLRKARKVEREVGPLKFEYQTDSTAAFEAMVAWKDAQHERTGRLQVMRYDWLVRLIRHLTRVDKNNTVGLFSTLHAGDQLLAVHLGLRSRQVIHIWFPAYDPAFEKYSPGLILLLRLMEAGAHDGIERLDFGKGRERYKSNFKTGDIQIAEGAIDLRPVSGQLRRRWYHTKRWIRQSSLQKPFEWPMEMTRRFRQKLAFD